MSSPSPGRLSKSDDPVIAPRLARNKLGVLGIAFFVLAGAAPIGALVGATPIVLAGTGAGAPLVIIAAGLLIALFSVGYLRMGKEIENAGGFVVFVKKGLGVTTASAAAGVVIVTYTGLAIGLWSLFGVFVQTWLRQFLSIEIPVWTVVLVGIWVAISMTIRGTDLGVKFLGVLLSLELIIAVILILVILFQTEPTSYPTPAQSFGQALNPGIGIAFLFAYAMFTGFEAPMVFSEEARNPRRTIPRALYLVIALITVLYSAATWAFSAAVGPERIGEVANEQLDGLVFALAQKFVGSWFEFVLQVVVIISFFAMMLASHSFLARYLFSLGRAGLLPKQLATISKKRNSPVLGAVTVGIIVTITYLPFCLSDVDPYTVYSWTVGVGTAGFIVILLLASVSILAYFMRNRDFSSPWSSITAPALSLLAASAVLWLVITNYDAVGGGGSVSRWLLLSIPLMAVLGAIVAIIRKRKITFQDVIG